MSNGSSARWLTWTGRHAPLSIGQFPVFAGVGGVGTLCHYAVLILGVELLHTAAVTASVAGSVVGAVTNFVLSARLAFASKASVLVTAPRFFLVAGVGIGLNWLVMWSLIKVDIQAQVVSTAPLKLATYLGLVVAAMAFLYGVWLIAKTILFGEVVPGYPTVRVTILLLGGTQLVAIGILGDYIGRMFDESKNRPLYLLNEVLGSDGASKARRNRLSGTEKPVLSVIRPGSPALGVDRDERALSDER